MTNFRPVPLTEHCVFSGEVFRKRSLAEVRELQRKALQAKQEQEGGG